MPHTSSMMSQRSNSPAISKSEFVNRPPGLSCVLTSCLMSSGHASLKTVGVHPSFSPSITPPTPCLEASFTPTNSGHAVTNSVHRVGRSVDSRRSVLVSWRATRSGVFLWRKTNVGRFCNSRLQGDKSPLPAGIARNAWRTLATTDSNSRNGIPVCATRLARSHWCRIVRSASRFVASSQTVFSSPSNVKPRMSFLSLQVPSPLLIFLNGQLRAEPCAVAVSLGWT